MNEDTKGLRMKNMSDQQSLPAGDFSTWLRSIRSALVKESGVDVDCGECKACCTSSYFIHIRPEEAQTLTKINKKLLFAAPGLPKGNVLLGYYENGHCPMQKDSRCTIYEHRPITCRNYDCRIFAAAGIAAGDEDKALITQQTERWRFDYPTKLDHDQHMAVQAAVRFLREHGECFPAGAVPSNPSQLAIFAIKVYDVFLKYKDEYDETGREAPDFEIAEAVMEAMKKFEASIYKYNKRAKKQDERNDK
jgi:Fe-S-cluster containining protein